MKQAWAAAAIVSTYLLSPPRLEPGFSPVDGLVSARETATGRGVQFKVSDSALLKSLKVGHKVYANFATKKVSLDGFEKGF